MPDNVRYRKGAIWRTRTKVKAWLDTDIANEQKWFVIPKDEHVVLLAYLMNRNFEEHVALLWNGKVVFAFKVDSAYQFDTDPGGFNTKDEKDDSQMQQ
jgi:hypothetical protein